MKGFLGGALLNSLGKLTFQLEALPPLELLEKEWRALDRHGAHSFFLSWTWIGALLRTQPGRLKLLKVLRGKETAGLALITTRPGRLAGLFPNRQGWLNATGERDVDGVMIEHNGFAVPGSDDPHLWSAFIDWFADGELAASELVVPGIGRNADPSPKGLLCSEDCRLGYRTPLSKVGTDGLYGLVSRNTRQQLRRSLRYVGGPVQVEVAPNLETAQAYFLELKALHIRSWTRRGRKHAFDNPFFEPFHYSVISEGVCESSVDLLRITAGERVLGYLYNFKRHGVISSYQSGFADDDPALRPGYLCHAAAIAHYAAQGWQSYDFLAGTNQLKQSLGVESYDLCWRRYRRPTLGARLDRLLHRAAKRLSASS